MYIGQTEKGGEGRGPSCGHIHSSGALHSFAQNVLPGSPHLPDCHINGVSAVSNRLNTVVGGKRLQYTPCCHHLACVSLCFAKVVSLTCAVLWFAVLSPPPTHTHTGAALQSAVESSLRAVNLWNNRVADKQARQYSGGMKRRLSVAISFMGNPLVVYLDEPSTVSNGRGCSWRRKYHEPVSIGLQIV